MGFSSHLHGCAAGERNGCKGVDAEVVAAEEQGVLDRDLGDDGEDEVLVAGLIHLEKFLGSDLAVGLLDLLGVGPCHGVVGGADLHDNGHLAVLIEVLEGVDGRDELAVDALVGYLEGTDVLQALDGHRLAFFFLLVEVDGLHDAAVDSID